MLYFFNINNLQRIKVNNSFGFSVAFELKSYELTYNFNNLIHFDQIKDTQKAFQCLKFICLHSFLIKDNIIKVYISRKLDKFTFYLFSFQPHWEINKKVIITLMKIWVHQYILYQLFCFSHLTVVICLKVVRQCIPDFL